MTSPAPLESLHIPLSTLRKIYKEARKRRNFYAVGARDIFRWWVQHEKDRRRIRWLEAERAAAAQREQALREDNERLRAQVEAGWEDVPLGEYHDVGGETLYIEWDDEQYVLSLDSFDSRFGSSWVLPDTWRLQRQRAEGQG